MMKTRLMLITLGLVLSSAASAAEVTTVAEVDLERYQGTWFEQSSFPMYFQRNCARNTMANYTLRSDGRIDVVNSCEKKDGDRITAAGVAKTAGQGTARLKVRFAPAYLSFLPFVWGDYWVIALDQNYGWVVVGSPDREYLWILSRDKVLSDKKLASIVAMAKAQGFDTSRLVRTEQR